MRAGSKAGRWLLALGCMQGSALCAAEADLSERDFFADLPPVLTASRLRQTAADAPNAITVIDRELIRASGIRDLPDIFRLVPGMYVSYQSYTRGRQGIVSYHGLASELAGRMQVLVDGRAVYNPTLGEVSWINLPLAVEDIERIEVVRGPSAAAHGANAFLGVINIITRHAAQGAGTRLTLNRGGDGVSDGLLRHGGREGNLDYRVTVGYRNDYGYAQAADDSYVRLLTFRGDYRLGSGDALALQAGYNGGPRVQEGNSLMPAHDIRIDNSFQQLRWQRMADAGRELSVQLFHNRLGLADLAYTVPLPLPAPYNQPLLIDDSIVADRYDLEFQDIRTPGADLRWVWGASLRQDTAAAPSTLAAPARNSSQRLFVNAEWRPAPAWLMNAGAMIEHTDLTGTDTSPRLSLTWQPVPGHSLRAGISRALRNPSLFEDLANRGWTVGPYRLQNFLSSGKLSPERIVSRELGYVFELPVEGFAFDARVFEDRLDRLIGVVSVPYTASPPLVPLTSTTRDFRNLDDVRQHGFESQLRWRPSREIQFGLAQARILTASGDIAEPYSESAPRDSFSLFGAADLGVDFAAGLFWYFQGRVRALGFSEPQAPFHRTDLRLAQRLRSGTSRAEAALVVQNLFDRPYTDFRHENVFRRRVWLSLAVTF